MAVRYSAWIWSPEHEKHYCGVYDEDNNLLQYQWEQDRDDRSKPRQQRPDPTEAEEAVSGYYATESSPPASTGSPTLSYTIAPVASSSYSASSYQQRSVGNSYNSYYQQSSAQPHTSSELSPYAAAHYNSASTNSFSYQQPATSQPNPVSEEARLQEKITEKVSHKHQRVLKTDNDPKEFEGLDPSYRRVAAHSHDNFFVQGRVFKMLWTEPAGQPAGGTRGSTHFSITYLGENAYSEIRRFVIIRNKQSFSQCIPIQTYRKKGATKKDVIAVDHAIIYTGEQAPSLLRGEVGRITKQAIRVVPVEGATLDEESRVNFGKPYAVEHNVKLVEIGMVSSYHIHLLETYFKEAMGL